MLIDDTKCLKITTNMDNISSLQDDPKSIWALCSELSFQPAKCVNLRISCKRHPLERYYSLNNNNVCVATSVCDLGVISNDL